MPTPKTLVAFVVFSLYLAVATLFTHDLSFVGNVGFYAVSVLFGWQVIDPRAKQFSAIGMLLVLATIVFYLLGSKADTVVHTGIATCCVLLPAGAFVVTGLRQSAEQQSDTTTAASGQ